MEQIVVITAVGQDRPGIVAALAQVLYERGANLDDATMTRLHGAFATMVSAKLPTGQTPEDVRQALAPIAARLELSVTVQGVDSEMPVDAPPDHLLTVYGADHPGIVYRVAERLARRGINITDMDTRVAGAPDAPVYVILLEVAAGESDLSQDLDALRQELGVNITAQPFDMEAL